MPTTILHARPAPRILRPSYGHKLCTTYSNQEVALTPKIQAISNLIEN